MRFKWQVVLLIKATLQKLHVFILSNPDGLCATIEEGNTLAPDSNLWCHARKKINICCQAYANSFIPSRRGERSKIATVGSIEQYPKSAALPLFCRFFRQMWQKSTPLYRSDLVAVGDISKGKQSSCWRKKNQFTVYTVLNFCWMYMPCTWYALSEKDEGIEAHNNYWILLYKDTNRQIRVYVSNH